MTDDPFTTLSRQLHAFMRRSRQERPAEGLSPTAFRVLRETARAETVLQPGQLAEIFAMAPSNVAATLRDLEHAGLLRRERDLDDARRVNITVTDDGLERLSQARIERAEWLRAAAEATLTAAERATLLQAGDLLERVAAYRREDGE